MNPPIPPIPAILGTVEPETLLINYRTLYTISRGDVENPCLIAQEIRLIMAEMREEAQ